MPESNREIADAKALHEKSVAEMQRQIRDHYASYKERPDRTRPLSLKYRTSDSFTMRTKSYKDASQVIQCGALNRLIAMDPIRQVAVVEPRMTMDSLLRATLPYGLTVPVIPELRNITVGGALMGIGGESGSHRWGTFNDVCAAFEFIAGDGTRVRASPEENPDLFYGIPGSYGSLGALVSAELKLIPAKDFVRLRYHIFKEPQKAIQWLQHAIKQSHPEDFYDGIIFSPNLAVIMEASLELNERAQQRLPVMSFAQLHSKMYYQHVWEIAQRGGAAPYEERMSHEDYFFRYDLGAFWMGSYLYHFPLLHRLWMEGIWKLKRSPAGFSDDEIKRFHTLTFPNALSRALMRPFASGSCMCRMLHQAEKWIQDRFIIQDFCIPEGNAPIFLDRLLEESYVYPIWLLPIKGTQNRQLFAPHVLSHGQQEGYFINFGVYGIPSRARPIVELTREYEQRTHQLGGRKILYARSYYTQDEFWQIYSRADYDALRAKTHAAGIWLNITDKVLST